MNFKCETPQCDRADAVDRLFNINVREAAAGKPQRRVVICGRCAREARKLGHVTYRYSETLKRDAERAAARNGRSQFFNDLLKVVTGKTADPSGSKAPTLAAPHQAT